MRTVGCLIFDGVRAFDYAVICEIWRNRSSRPGLPPFDLRVCGPAGHRVRLGSGLERVPDFDLDALADCDLVVVPGTERPTEPRDPAVLDALRAAHARGTTVASLCAGAFVLAEAGLLDGRAATTHWAYADELARRYPLVDVRPEVLFIGEEPLWTSAGEAAGIDLCLHLVRAAHGERAAATIARSMVTAPFRSGGQAQFIPSPVPENADAQTDDPLARVRTEVLAALDTPWTVRRMAGLALMSERSFARRFVAGTGTTPLRWLLDQRILTAQRLLEDTDLPVDTIAVHCGFGSAVSLRPPFTTRLGVPPREYRRTFRGKDGD
ncbi:helix-turn-helix domain-containing protein [Kitasatospora sp. NPDC093806]|uniref:GlxA family transcriptional regulator n=1 Tax=Kitasatospora sp. NPDC093806 TaxID=3155075 RepID=UPI00343065E9